MKYLAQPLFRLKFWRVWVLVGTVLLPGLWGEMVPVALGAPPLILSGQTRQFLVAPHMDSLEDPQGQLTFEQIASGALESRWRHLEKSSVNFGFSDSTYWFRFTLINHDAPQSWILGTNQTWALTLDWFMPSPLGLLHQVTGLGIPLDLRSVPDKQGKLQINLAPGESQTYYMRYEGGNIVILHPVLLLPGDDRRADNLAAQIDGIYAGLVGGLVLFNLFLFFALRDKTYLYYTLYLTGYGLLLLLTVGFFHGYLDWGLSRAENNRVYWSGDTLAGILPPLLLLFIREFLRVKQHSKLLDRIYIGFSALVVLFILFSLFYPLRVYAGVLDVAFQLGHLLVFITALVFWRRGVRQAPIIALALVPEMVGIMVTGFGFMGLIPLTPVNLRASMLGSALEITLFSLALAARYQQLRQEKELAMRSAGDNALLAAKRLQENQELQRAIEQRHQAEKALLAAKEQAESATQLKDKFVALVAHDIRSPLSAIIAYLRAMQSDTQTPLAPQHQEFVDLSLEKTGVFLRNMEDLLSLNRLQTGNLVPKQTRFDLWELAEETALLSYMAKSKGISLRQEVPQRSYFYGDPVLLGEVLRNLVNNAIKFCHAGDTIRIYMPNDRPNCIAVGDTGPGVDPELLPHLFNPTVKTSTPGSAGETGTGMGLPLCHEIVAAHGGSLSVTSMPGQGSIFCVQLPTNGN